MCICVVQINLQVGFVWGDGCLDLVGFIELCVLVGQVGLVCKYQEIFFGDMIGCVCIELVGIIFDCLVVVKRQVFIN